MRSPWQIFRDLGLGRRDKTSVERATDNPILPDSKSDDQGKVANPTPSVLLEAVTTVEQTNPVLDNEVQPEIKQPAGELLQPAPDDILSVSEPEQEVDPAPSARMGAARRRAKKIQRDEGAPGVFGDINKTSREPRNTSAKNQRAPVARPAATRVPPKNVFASEKALGLDDEIRELRARLSLRLVEQNEWLRRMLERYES